MLSFESVKQRLARESPLSFLEFNYMILQAYDFLELSRRHEAVLQFGGSDQWGNIINGVELGRKVCCSALRTASCTAPAARRQLHGELHGQLHSQRLSQLLSELLSQVLSQVLSQLHLV